MKKIITRNPKVKNIIKLKKYFRENGRSKNIGINSERK